MNILSLIFSEKIITTLGWTLVHSLWQGMVIALLFALATLFLRRHSPKIRYFSGMASLALILSVSTATFVGILQSTTVSAESAPAALASLQTTSGFWSGLTTAFHGYFNQHLPLIVTIWIMGIMFLFFKMTGSLVLNQRIKRVHTKSVSKNWNLRFQSLRKQINLKKDVLLRESMLAKIPMTIGFFKPVILVPMGMLTGMPQQQMETLLMHELAHILRKDYLFNIIQNMVEILYFFHPGIRWISSQVRHERENCCDDMVVNATGQPLHFAKALAFVQEMPAPNTDLAMAASGQSHHLLKRVRRLLDTHRKKTQIWEQFTGSIILGLFILILSLSSQATASPGKSSSPQPPDDQKQTQKEKGEEEEWRKIKEEFYYLKSKDTLTQEEKDKLKKIRYMLEQKDVKMKQKEEEAKLKELKLAYYHLKSKKKLTKKETAELDRIAHLLKERGAKIKQKEEQYRQEMYKEEAKFKKKEHQYIKERQLKMIALNEKRAELSQLDRELTKKEQEDLKKIEMTMKKILFEEEKLREEEELYRKEMMLKEKALRKKHFELKKKEQLSQKDMEELKIVEMNLKKIQYEEQKLRKEEELHQKEMMLKEKALREKHHELKKKEQLTQKEMEQLKIIEMKMKQLQYEEQKLQKEEELHRKEMTLKEEALKAKYAELSKLGRELTKSEKEELEKIKWRLEKLWKEKSLQKEEEKHQ